MNDGTVEFELHRVLPGGPRDKGDSDGGATHDRCRFDCMWDRSPRRVKADFTSKGVYILDGIWSPVLAEQLQREIIMEKVVF